MPLTSPGKFKTDANGNSYGGDGIATAFLATAADNVLLGKDAAKNLTSAVKNVVIGSASAPLLTPSPARTT